MKQCRKERLKIIPNKTFRQLWEAAQKEDKDSFTRRFTFPSSEERIDFYKLYGISPSAAYQMLDKIYKLANMTFKEILELTGKRKYQISDLFCIPIRTVEEWYTGNNRCPSYVRLMILNNYYKINLGKRIITEGEKERRDNRPSIYASKAIQEKYKKKVDSEFDDIDKKLAKIGKETSKHDIIPKGSSVEDLLARTAYLTALKGYPHKKEK